MIDDTEQIQLGRAMVRLIEAATLLLPDADQREADLVRRRARTSQARRADRP